MSPIQKSPKISNFFICETCDYKCCKQSEYNKHILTNKHKILQNPTLDTTTNSPKFSKIFECEKCDYTCCKKGDFNKHILTNKHKILQNPTLDTTPKVYLCKCGKKYKHSSTLYTHKKMCAYKENIVVENTPITTTDSTNPIIIEKMFAMFTQMMTQNQDYDECNWQSTRYYK